MAKELNEETGFVLSIKTLIGIGFAMATIISMWFMLQADIEEAKQLPVPPPAEITAAVCDATIEVVGETPTPSFITMSFFFSTILPLSLLCLRCEPYEHESAKSFLLEPQ